ncbi:ATP synthase subunit 5, mitochondrial [Fulvia fulva]|uniref:ATP synthase subunit 5, mitochondrial n=1 Tax=Passalora fulva TaxID=5499 RepID=A0A9Q8P2U9_PASFU|nr:ATP synthase subunit 5, mitochondrial [Fulvia fulva]KAK4636020.1 ATP synthase subunit 5, mitochondrial [Fulvia fulva]KAK4638617.1 ATP synthase subunit 5, mitochondrial [Fulvia fulva]UJO11278.1 ATP synthase subunit 5, mitochondrial [Fulvia fulva]WPV09037.1 ATP synthase subunit 5, mitochondrial [Fulvia fulva]WPV24147.1 ATP synthase subunit 5, mitochondrial [Fulvia fulva]
MFAGRVAVRSARVAAPRFNVAATRSFAEAAAKPAAASGADTRPPIEVFGVDGTYASALYTAAAKSSSLDNVSKAIDSLHQTFKKDPKLASIIQAPTLTVEDKKQIVQELQKTTGVQDKTNTITNFLNTLAENNRLSVLEGVCEKFAQLISASKGEVELTITSAAPLDSKIVKQLEAAISKSQYVGQGKKLKVTPKVNPDIRGGLVVEIGDRTIDLSVSSKMHKMNNLLQTAL